MRPASGTASCARTLHRTVGEKDMLVVLSHWVGRDGVTITCSVSSCFGQACLVLHLELARDTAVHERMGRKPLLHSAPAQNSLPASVRLHPLPRVGCGKNGTGRGAEQEHRQIPPFPSHFFFPSRSHLKDVASLRLS